MSKIIHNIGDRDNPNYTTREALIKCKDDIITFDGIYQNVYDNKDIIEQKLKEGKRVILFWTSDYLGGDNDFDVKNPFNGAVVYPERFINMEQLRELEAMGCELGWHTISHRDLTKLSKEEQIKEIKPPFHMKSFCYPYGKWNSQVVDIVKEHFTEGWSVERTDGTQFTKQRTFI